MLVVDALMAAVAVGNVADLMVHFAVVQDQDVEHSERW